MRSLPSDGLSFSSWPWIDIEPHYEALINAELNTNSLHDWLRSWSELANLISERGSRHYVATSVNTADLGAKAAYESFLDEIFPKVQQFEEKLRSKLLDSGLSSPGLEVPLRNLSAQSNLYREDNVPLLAEQYKLNNRFDQIAGSQTVVWEGEEIPLSKLARYEENADRGTRERAWRLGINRRLEDREQLNALWVEFFELRKKIASNAGKSSFRDYIWDELLRFDYTPQDCATFRESIRTVVVPLAKRIYEERREALNLDSLRPWDVDAVSEQPLRPFATCDELDSGCSRIFARLDADLSAYYEDMRQAGLLDLDSRKNKAPGGYCTNFDAVKKPFIFMNASGAHDDVQTLLHEAGHAFHVYESANLPYHVQLAYTSEIAEVASMSMELLAAPYLDEFYVPKDVARARKKHLEKIVLFWPYMAVVDGFQHWAYQNPERAIVSNECDKAWSELWDQFMPGIDYTGLEAEKATGWHRKLHIFQGPFYYVEYGMAQLGALQVWRNSLSDPGGAMKQYRQALSLGGSQTLPELFASAGARFSFDEATIRACVGLIEKTLAELNGELS
ncbi:MAG TPA: M3 family oligoendopeptidase [Fimbriimonadaceae bacterium]|nr:M3 family oligoendopeptidase [Fimbriimonadaceae bacterium]